jgi:hypothetical protein
MTPLYQEEQREKPPKLVVPGSLAVVINRALSWAWRPDFRRDHAVLGRMYDERPDLVQRVRTFWEPHQVTSCGGSIELMILAHHGGLLLSLDPGQLLGRLEELCRDAPVDLGLVSETAEDRAGMRSRLEALRSDPEVRARYVELVNDVWSALADDWERDGRSAVAGAVAERRALHQKGASWREVARLAECLDYELIVAELIPALGADGLIAVVPAYFAHLGLLVDVPGTVLIGVRADGSGAQPRALTELLARRL